jgi:malate dehydrogenase (oxaloacetate-decarboxylating)
LVGLSEAILDTANYRVVRTLRCRDANIPGTLGKLATAIGHAGAEIGNIGTVHRGHHFTIRDIEVLVDSEQHLENLISEISKLREVLVLEVRDEVLELHKHGKIKTVNSIQIDSLDILQKVYTPGVAEVCNLIAKQPEWKDTYTIIPNTIAIVTDGTAVLGLGNIGAVAGMPVMEGKSALLYQLVGVSGIPILLNTTDPNQIIDTVRNIAPTFAGIHLEDIASPRCFQIEETLDRGLSIPVMHDDQRGTAVVTLAALLNACKRTNISIHEANVGVIGLGAAGFPVARFLFQYTGKPVLGADKVKENIQRHVEHGGIASTVEEIMQKADIVIALTAVGGLITSSMIKKGQIIFALSNPYPEIVPEAAIAAGAVLAADGKTVNNLLSFPGIWRGALDAKARKINFEMYKAASLAIANATAEGELVPNSLDPKMHLKVAHSVAKAAIESGVAQRQLDDDYFEDTNLKASF